MGEVSLRCLSIDDTQNIVRWRNSDFVRKNLFSQQTLTNEHIEYYESKIKTGKCKQFIIVIKEDGKSMDVGTVFIKNLDYANSCGEFGIFIGEELARGKGYGKKATEQVLKYGFEVLGLNRIYLNVLADNTSAIKIYEHVGFIQEGIMRESFCRNKESVDVIIMAFLKCSWKERTSQ